MFFFYQIPYTALPVLNKKVDLGFNSWPTGDHILQAGISVSMGRHGYGWITSINNGVNKKYGIEKWVSI